MGPNNKILEEGYELVTGGRNMTTFMRTYPGTGAKKHSFNKGNGFEPGRNDDMSQSYHRGSLIITDDGNAFMCVDATPEKANWIKLGGPVNFTTSSFDSIKKSDPSNTETVEIPVSESGKSEHEQKSDSGNESEEEETPDGTPEMAKTKSETHPDQPEEKEKKPPPTQESKPQPGNAQFGADMRYDPKNEDGKIEDRNMAPEQMAVPKDIPWFKYLEKNSFASIKSVKKAIKDDTLKDEKWMNEKRSKEVDDWIKENV